MLYRCRCGSEIPEARSLAGYATCIKCGNLDASREIQAKATRVGVAYNKGNYVYLGEPEVARRTALEGGNRKSPPIMYDNSQKQPSYFRPLTGPITHNCPKLTQNVNESRKIVGMYFSGGERIYLYEGQQAPNSATRVVRFKS